MQRPLTDSFTLVYAFDDALDRDRFRIEGELGEDGAPLSDDDAEKAARSRYAEEYMRCVEQLDFSSITRPGATPTSFRFRPLSDSDTRKMKRHASGDRDLIAWLTVRMTLEEVTSPTHGLPAKLDRKVDPDYPDLGPIIAVKWMDALGRWSQSLGQVQGDATNDLGIIVAARSTRPSPR